MTFDPATVALGRKPGVVHDPRTFRLGDLLTVPSLPPIPGKWRMAGALHEVPVFANDRYGCCTFASQGHRIVAQERSSRQHEPRFVNTDDVLEAYSAVTGFRAEDPGTDNGAYMLDVANYMRTTGLGLERDGTRHTVDGFVKVDHTDHREVETACVLFGGVWVGVWLPRSAQQQTGPGRIWDAVSDSGSEPGSWGGHAVTVPGYDTHGLELWTWGFEQRMTWAFWDRYVDECYAFISEDWFRRTGTTPRGFNIDQLRAWLSELG